MRTVYETDAFSWCYDNLHGVGRFIRKSDNAVTLLETGDGCVQVIESLDTLAIKHPGRNPYCFDSKGTALFDAIAAEYEFHDGDTYTPLPAFMPQETD